MNEIIKSFMDRKILLSPEIFEKIKDDSYSDMIERYDNKNILVLTNELLEEKNQEDIIKIKEEYDKDRKVRIIKNYGEESGKRVVKDFVSHFKLRYNKIKNILINRPELQNTLSIIRGIEKNNENVSFIGIIFNKLITKNGDLSITLEDLTGRITFLVKRDKECFNIAKDLVLDEIIGVTGLIRNKTLYANNIFIPDIPYTKELKKSNEDGYAAFISDIHVGSNVFLEEDFEKFIKWINLELGDKKHKEKASKIKYLFIIGDLVDGVGIYPDQDLGLKIKDINEQYEKLAYYLGKIRKDISLIICPGNHDALRLSEPQPCLDKNIAKKIWELPNVFLVSNPALVNIHFSEDFDGFDVLMYHGSSMHYFVDNVESLRLGNAKDNPSLVAKFLLQRRHLAPTHGSSIYVPYKDNDHLVIDKIPDFFVLGEMHRPDELNYNNTTIINCSCWQSKTPYEEKMGNNPIPSIVTLVDLKNREISKIDFSKNDK